MEIKRIALTATIAAVAAAMIGCTAPKDGEYSFKVLTTNDIHGTYFDSTYVGNGVKRSLYAVKYVVDSVRRAAGKENVILIDAGDILQGDNAAYYFNYVDTVTPHVYPRMAAYMEYDAVVAGNHDIETGHACYDRVAADLEASGIPFLAGNAIRTSDGKPYFGTYTILRRHGVKIAVLGFDNANISNWLSESLWYGMTFENLIPLVQEQVDAVKAKEKPHIVIVAVHSATGDGDGSQLESQGLDLMNTLQGVDLLVCSHDHKPAVVKRDSICLVNSGSHCRYVGMGGVDITVRKGKVVGKELDASLIAVDRDKVDTAMRTAFHDDYAAVKAFSTAKVGELAMDLRTRDAYRGMCDYLNLIHTICLKSSGADISFAAPLTFNGFVKGGDILYNDLFTIYPFENTLNVVEMTGKEIKDYLEASYDRWITTVRGTPGEHVLKIAKREDQRTGQKSWSFIERSYNFDSAGGLDYTVDVTKPFGSRISISSFADGSTFNFDQTYKVAMTSYRANGGGSLLSDAGIDTDTVGERTASLLPEIRELLYNYLKENNIIRSESIGDEAVIGHWSFIPESVAGPLMEEDMKLLFPARR